VKEGRLDIVFAVLEWVFLSFSYIHFIYSNEQNQPL